MQISALFFNIEVTHRLHIFSKVRAKLLGITLVCIGNLIALLGTGLSFADEHSSLRFSGEQAKLEHIQKWINKNSDNGQLKQGAQPVSRLTAEFLIQVRALEAAGFNFNYELIPSPNWARTSRQAAQNQIDLSVESYWVDSPNIDHSVFWLSEAVLKQGETQVGLFTYENNHKALAAKNLDDVRKLKHVTVKTWHADINTIEAYNPIALQKVDSFEAMIRVLKRGRADVGLVEFFGEPDFRHNHFGTIIQAIPNMKVGLLDERVFAVSKQHPQSKQILEALNRGISLLRKNGELKKMLSQAGYYPKEVENWPYINLGTKAAQ
ncbi:hypothetical protein [Agaribacterium sp. ZY112]|uniref:hypothetical protein n=1 Tax=Agaribacterium sp. ZY112 TaxID=3233574 RepID=UPI00352444C8